MATTETLIYRDGDTECHGHLAVPDGADGPRPCVLIAHAFKGQGDFERQRAARIADELGYVGFALDMYGGGQFADDRDGARALMGALLKDRAGLQQRITAGLDAARNHAAVDGDRVAAIGFCFGGLCALDLARSGADVRGVIPFHGLFTPDGLGTRPIKAKVLVCHGYDDPMAKPDSMVALCDELTAAGADWQVHAYGGTVHAFTNPAANDASFGTVYSDAADRRSWQAMVNFLAEVLA